MSILTVENIYLEKIWDVFCDANEDHKPMLSGNEETQIMEILKEYRSNANEADKSTDKALILPVVVNCPNCGSKNIENNKVKHWKYFCPDCGQYFS